MKIIILSSLIALYILAYDRALKTRKLLPSTALLIFVANCVAIYLIWIWYVPIGNQLLRILASIGAGIMSLIGAHVSVNRLKHNNKN